MDTHMIVEMVGYAGSILVVVSVLMSSLVKLRVINSIGAFIFAIYALIIQSYPTAIMNFCLVAINIYYLVRLSKQDKHYELRRGSTKDAVLAYMLDYYKEDITQYFSGWKGDMTGIDTVYLVGCDGAPVGILLGKAKEKGRLEVVLEYSTPAYRDCSVGKYLYSRLPEQGVHTLQFSKKPGKHESYLQKMGFVKEDNSYVKKLG